MFKFFSSRRIYLDHASSTPLLPEALAAMNEAARLFGNPGAIHADGVAALRSLTDSRERIAAIFGAKPRELIFTSGLTESVNLAIIGRARLLARLRGDLKGTHWVTSSMEHSAVLESFAKVESLGGAVTHIAPDARGLIAPEVVANALKKETVFVSIGWANNEIGTIQPLSNIARVIREHEKSTSLTCIHKSDLSKRVIFHTDAGQAPLYLPTVIHSLGVDLASFGAAKLYGPHGIGALYVGKDTELAGIIVGGKQERGLRAGTENVMLAAGFAAALEKIALEREKETTRLRGLRNELATKLQERIPGLVVNGSLEHALPHMLNVSIPDVSSEYVTLALDHEGISVSTKSACREGEESRSHAVAALLTGQVAGSQSDGGWRAAHTLRFSLGRDTAERDIQKTAEALMNIVHRNATFGDKTSG